MQKDHTFNNREGKRMTQTQGLDISVTTMLEELHDQPKIKNVLASMCHMSVQR